MYDLWADPLLMWGWIIANTAIFLAYSAIGIRHLLVYGGVGWLYGAFILSCGIGHLVMTIFMAWAQTTVLWAMVVFLDVLTAAVSLAAARAAPEG